MINEDILSLNSSAKGSFPSLWNSEKEIEFIFKFSFKNPFAKSEKLFILRAKKIWLSNTSWFKT